MPEVAEQCMKLLDTVMQST